MTADPLPDAPGPSDATLDLAVEALVFASDVPLRAEDIARAVGEVTGSDVLAGAVEATVERLNAAFDAGGRAVRVERWGGGYRLATVDDAAPFVRALFEDAAARPLSRALLETLAVVAYTQPATRPEIDHARGVASDYAVRQLLDLDLVRLAGRGDGVGRPLLYATTDRFLDQFGLESLDALPRPREIAEILADPAFSAERARLLAERLTAAPDAAPPLSDSAAPAAPTDAA